MSTTFFEPVAEKKGLNPLGLKGIDHIEFIVDDADQWRDFFVNDKLDVIDAFQAERIQAFFFGDRFEKRGAHGSVREE